MYSNYSVAGSCRTICRGELFHQLVYVFPDVNNDLGVNSQLLHHCWNVYVAYVDSFMCNVIALVARSGGGINYLDAASFPSVCINRKRLPVFCSIPVSYTHLDVYKRQLYHCARFFAVTVS